jgi:hypothetical protein
MSLQLQPGLALDGERYPFVPFSFPSLSGVTAIGDGLVVDGVAGALALDCFFFFVELLLFALALLDSLLESSSISSSIGTCDAILFFLADLVTGPEYPPCDSSFLSEGVGEGEITLGIAGIMLDEEYDMLKGGREDMRMTPVRTGPTCEFGRSQ